MIGLEHIKITQNNLVKTCEIDEFKGLWRGLEQHTTSLQMLADVAVFGKAFGQTLLPLKDQTIDSELLCQLHGRLSGSKTKSDYKIQDERLEIFKDDAFIGALDTAPPEDVAPLTAKLLDWADNALKRRDLHPLVTIAVFSAVFLQISPFDKQNQKLLQLLITVFMLKSGYSYAPYISLNPLINTRAAEYHAGLKQVQDSIENGRPDWSLWLAFFLDLLKDQAGTLSRRLNARDKDVSHLPTLSGRIMKLFEEHERLQMKQIVKITNGRRSTIKLRLNELADQGYLRRHGQARSTWYSLT